MDLPDERKRPPEEPIDLLSPSPTRRFKSPRISDSSISIIDLQDDDDDLNITVGGNKSQDDVRIVKRVHFDDIEHEVYYFQPYPVELFDEIVSPEKASSKRTADYTVLSSQHGRDRRQLRNISKRDLKAAIKHGVKTPAHPGKDGSPRWKFTYNNVVYITDSTCRQEITSYVEAIKIERHPISNALMDRHNEVKRILNDQPELCTGHTYIVIDQSGSMREADVNGFRSRSHASYGVLALDFVAEQLSTHNGDDLLVESVTVIEMRNEGEIILERQPFDWVLFNALVQRPNDSRPYSHGNFNPSLLLVKDLILKEYNSLKDKVEKEELPNFTLVFLSDGKPSDGYQNHQSRADVKMFDQQRVEILQLLTQTLESKFSLYTMGVGSSKMEFNALSTMVDVVKNSGGAGQLFHAGLDAVTMGNSFSAISTTMTSVRTDLLASGQTAAADNTKKDFELRETGKIVGKVFKMDQYINGKKYSIKRFRFDKELYKRKMSPWRDVGFAAHRANGFEIEKRPLGEGAERLAYRFNEISYNNETKTYKKVGKIMVAKNSILANEKETKDHFHIDFCRVQSKAYDLAEKFNHAVRTATRLKSVSDETRPPEIKFIMCHVYTYTDLQTNEETAVLVERFLNGKFTKYNSNNGYVKKASDCVNNTHIIETASGRVHLEEFLQAFSHWVYVESKNRMVVCDLQGVMNEEGRYPEFLLTDPAICTNYQGSANKENRYGKTDMRMSGIRKFCHRHKCGIVCRGLGLPTLQSSSAPNLDDRKPAAV